MFKFIWEKFRQFFKNRYYDLYRIYLFFAVYDYQIEIDKIIDQKIKTIQQKIKSFSQKIKAYQEKLKQDKLFLEMNASEIANPPLAVEQLGIIPRSIILTLNRFVYQFFEESDEVRVFEYTLTRFQFIVTIQYGAALLLTPFFVHGFLKPNIVRPTAVFLWNHQPDIYFTNYLEKQALIEVNQFEEQLYFRVLARPSKYKRPLWADYIVEDDVLEYGSMSVTEYQNKCIDVLKAYNKKSIDVLIAILTDLFIGVIYFIIIVCFPARRIIFKSVVVEYLFSLNDGTKAFWIFYLTNFLVGFHSPPGWELCMEMLFHRYGLPPNEVFMLGVIGSVPVLLDCLFKYWIFRYLNRESPTTVVTYNAFIE